MLQDSQSIIAELKALHTKNVKQAESKLKYRARQGLHFLVNLHQIINRPDVQQNVKISAISFINSSILDNLEEINSTKCLQLQISIIINENISNFAKKLLHSSLVELIEISDLQQLENLIQILFDLMMQIDKKDIAYFIIACFAQADLDEQIFMPFVSKIFEPCLKLSPFFYKFSRETQLSNQNLNIQYYSCEAYVRTMKELVLSLMEIFTKLIGEISKYPAILKDPTKRAYLNKKIDFIFDLSNNELLCEMFKQILNYQSRGKILVCCDGALAQYINNLKDTTAEFLTKLLSFIEMVNSNRHKRKQHKLNSLVLDMIQPITTTLILFADNRDKIDDFNVESYLASLLKVMTYFFNNFWKQTANTIWKQTHEQIIYRFLQADEAEKQLFQQNFEEFNAFFEDCCNKQQSSNLKSQSCKLLQTIGNFQPNTITYACQRAILSLIRNLNLSIRQQELESSLLQMATTQRIRIMPIQQSFFILSACSYHISQLQQKDKNLLKMILSSDSIDSLHSFEISRLFFFLSYSYSDLFTKQQGSHLIKYAFYRRENDPVSLSGLDFISNNLDYCFDQELIKLMIQSLPKPQSYNLESNNCLWKYFAILQSIMSNYTESLSTQLVKGIVDGSIRCLQILIELHDQFLNTKYVRTTKVSTQLIYQITHILQITLKKVNIIKKKLNNGKIQQSIDIANLQKQYDNVKISIWKVNKFLDVSIKLNLDDQLIRIIIQFIKYEHYIQKQSLLISPLNKIIQMFKLLKYSNASYLVFFNQFFMKCQASDCQPILKLLIEGLKHHIENFKLPNYFGNFKIITTYFLLILQNLLAIHGADYDQKPYFLQIVQLCCMLIPQNNQQIFCQPLVSRAINLLMVCHLYYPNNIVFNLLLQLHQKQIFRSYDLSVLLQCISKQIGKQLDIVAKAEYINISIRLLQQQKILRQQEVLQKDQIQKLTKKQLINNYQIILDSITSPFKIQKTNVQIVRQVLRQLKLNEPYIYTQILKNLNLDIVSAIQQILETQSKRKIFRVKGTKNSQDHLQEVIEVKKRTFQEEPISNIMQSDEQMEQCRKRQQACKKQKEIKQARQLLKSSQNQ